MCIWSSRSSTVHLLSLYLSLSLPLFPSPPLPLSLCLSPHSHSHSNSHSHTAPRLYPLTHPTFTASRFLLRLSKRPRTPSQTDAIHAQSLDSHVSFYGHSVHTEALFLLLLLLLLFLRRLLQSSILAISTSSSSFSARPNPAEMPSISYLLGKVDASSSCQETRLRWPVVRVVRMVTTTTSKTKTTTIAITAIPT